jgi:hypothetical protein
MIAKITQLQGDNACGLMFTDTTLNRQFTYNCSTHSWEALGSSSHTVLTPTTGSTITTQSFTEYIINPAGTLANLTISIPSYTPLLGDNDKIYFKFTQAISSISFTGGTVVAAPSSITAGQQFHLTYDSATNSWY